MCCVSIIEIEKLCKENTECKAEQAYVRNQKPVPMIPMSPYIVGDICLLGRQLYPDIKKIYRNSDGRNEATVWKEEETDKSWGCTGYKIGAGVDLWKIVRLEVNYRNSSSSIVKGNGFCLSAGLKLHL